jgi:hypothetical protein
MSTSQIHMESADDPTVMEARCAFMKAVDRLQDGALCCCSNYADQQFMACIQYMAESNTLTPEALDELDAAYAALMDAYAPFQPSAEVLAAAGGAEPGKVFYFLPTAGRYWVENKDQMKAMTDHLRGLLQAKKDCGL